MAIKGKRKPKARSGRVVTAGPRPAYVPPKVPPFQRTGAKFLVALLFEAAIFSLLVGFGEQSETDREKAAVTEFTSLVDASLSRAGAAVQPTPAGVLVLPQLATRVTEIQTGSSPEPSSVIPELEEWGSALTAAADGIAQLDVPEENLEPEQRLALTEARNLMDRGLRTFVTITDELKVAAQIEGDPQQELIETINAQIAIAKQTFDSGFGKVLVVATEAGLAPTTPQDAGIPPVGVPSEPFPSIEIPAGIPGAEGGGGGGGNGGGNGGGGGGGNG